MVNKIIVFTAVICLSGLSGCTAATKSETAGLFCSINFSASTEEMLSNVQRKVEGGCDFKRYSGVALARLSQLEGVQIANSLISLKSLFEGRHYSGIKPGLRCAWAGR